MFGSIGRAIDGVGSSLAGTATTFGTQIDQRASEYTSSVLLDNFRSTNVVQLISRSSGRSLQIVKTSTGQLTVDGLGPEGAQATNAHWTVMNEGHNTIRIHNQNNYLALKDGFIYVVNYPQPHLAGFETRFRLHQMSATHVSLESATPAENGRHLGIIPNGQIKSPIACGRESDSHFGVRLIYTAYPVVMPPQTTVVQGQGATVIQVQQGQGATVVRQVPPK